MAGSDAPSTFKEVSFLRWKSLSDHKPQTSPSRAGSTVTSADADINLSDHCLAVMCLHMQ